MYLKAFEVQELALGQLDNIIVLVITTTNIVINKINDQMQKL